MPINDNEYTDLFTAETINDEPEVYQGLTASEWSALFRSGAGYSGIFILALTVLSWPLTPVVGLLLGLAITYVVFKKIVKRIPEIRDGKPPGYLEHYVGGKGFRGLLGLAFGKRKREIESEIIMYSLGREGEPDE